MIAIDTGEDLGAMDAALETLPNSPAVFLLWPAEGQPYLSRTGLLRRRLLRLLRERERPSRLLNLRHTVRRIEYRLTGSALESGIVLYELARDYFPETYLRLMKLRMPPYVKIVLSNEFPRTQVTAQLSGGTGKYFGPFRSRVAAERFDAACLDLFQMRRCQEDLIPSPEHPGCMYGEMGMCLRPCQEVVGPAEYAGEVARVVEFFETGGHSLLTASEHSRDRLSEEMRFEEAARQHKRCEKIQEALRLRDELAADVDRLNGIAITRSAEANAVELWFVREGNWLRPGQLSFEIQEGKPVSLDSKLRETLANAAPRKLSRRERQEYLAILSRWFYSSWRDGEWLAFEDYGSPPYRKLVNAISRVVGGHVRQA